MQFSEATLSVRSEAQRRWRLLVIDDEEIDRLSIQRALEALGHHVMAVNDGAAGIEAGNKFVPQIVFVDIQMPNLDGYDVCELIRKQAWGRSAAIYAITGFKNLEDLQRAHTAGFDGFLAKPLDADVLARLLR
jgi:CheY-like chemotaxis protein